jgi:hypothetical protein
MDSADLLMAAQLPPSRRRYRSDRSQYDQSMGTYRMVPFWFGDFTPNELAAFLSETAEAEEMR